MTAEAPRELRFGQFRFDPATYQVFAGSTPVALTPKALDLLKLLLDARGRVVTKNDLLARLWPDAVVEETNLTQTVFLLRKALQPDEQGPEVVATVARRGYRLALPVEDGAPPPPGVSASTARPAWWIAAGTLMVTAIVAVIWVRARPGSPRPDAGPTVRFAVSVPDGWSPGSIALSADGRRLAFVAARPSDGQDMLWLRWLDALEAQPVAGSEGAMYPFLSSDGTRVGFFANGRLWIADPRIGRPRDVTAAHVGCGGAWLPDGRIVFSSGPGEGLSVVSEDGTGRRPFTQRSSALMSSPAPLPDGRHVLFYAPPGVWVASLDGSPATLVAKADASGQYAAGRLLFVRDAHLLAQPFDVRSLRVSGEPTTIAEPVVYNRASGKAAFAISEAGTVLAYRSGDIVPSQVAWVDREGRLLGKALQGAYLEPAISRDAQHVAVEETAPAGHRSWVVDLESGAREAVSPDEIVHLPLWSHDGRRILYRNALGVFEKTLGSTTPPRRVLDVSSSPLALAGLAPGGDFILSAGLSPSGWDILAWPLAPGGRPYPLVNSPANEREPELSSDGAWLAYVSDESGSRQVYIQDIGGSGRRTRVSVSGGEEPRWRGDGRELFFVNDGALWSVAVAVSPALAVGAPRRLFAVNLAGVTMFRSRYQVSPDGQRFLVCRMLNPDRSITVVTNAR